jgi:hypothetical protein
MKHTKLFIKIYLFSTLVVALAFLSLKAPGFYYMYKAKQAIAEGGFPSQYGIASVVATPCVCSVPVVKCASCIGGMTCKDVTNPTVATCPTYEDITGAQAGGDGASVLLLTMAAAQIGLSSGGQVICGGTTQSMLNICGSVAGVTEAPN